jgi:CHAT domain-containing protein
LYWAYLYSILKVTKTPFFLSLLLLYFGLPKASAQTIAITQLETQFSIIKYQVDEGVIAKENAIKPYQTIQQQYLRNKAYPQYLEMFYQTAALYARMQQPKEGFQVLETGIRQLDKYPLSAIAKDTLVFKLLSERCVYASYVSEHHQKLKSYFEITYQHFEKNKYLLEKSVPINVSSFLVVYAKWFKTQGEIEQYHLLVESALNICGKYPYQCREMYPTILSELGVYYQEIGNYTKAYYYYAEAIQENKKIDAYSAYVANVYWQIATCHLVQKEYTKALQNIQIAFQLKQQTKEVANDYKNLQTKLYLSKGEALLGLGQWQEAQRNFQLAIQIYQKTNTQGKGAIFAQAYLGLSRVAEAQHTFSISLQYAQKALQASHSTFKDDDITYSPSLLGCIARNEMIEALTQKACLFQKTNHPFTLETYLKLIDEASIMRKTLVMAESKLWFTDKVNPIYGQAVDAFAQALNKQPNNTILQEQCFKIFEASKAAVLSDVLSEQKIRPATVDGALLRQDTLLRNQRVVIQSALRGASAKEQPALLQKLSEVEMQLNNLIKVFEKKSPQYFQLKYDTKLVSLNDVRKQLHAQSALISYFWGTEKLYIMVVSKASFQFVEKKNSPVLQRIVMSLHAHLSMPGIDRYKGHQDAVWLYQEVFKPIRASLKGINRLVVLRANELNLIPFEILEPKGINDYLVKQFSFQYGHSATLLYYTGIKLNASVSVSNANVAAYAPFGNNTNEQLLIQRHKDLKPLPASIEEVKSIRASRYINDAATKKSFMNTYQGNGVLHLATHAQIDDENPDNSFIAFFPSDTNNFLYNNEVYNLDLDQTKLVVLGACETGAGKISKGEGLISLARGFLYAGCPSVVTTLWNAHDRSTAVFSEQFYNLLEDGVPIDLALQKAKFSLINSQYEHPYYWANMILIGRTTVIQFSWWNGYQSYIYMCLVALIALFVYWRVR